MAGRDIIVIGGSAGGVEVLLRLVCGLPAGLPAALFVASHYPPHARSALPEMLSRAGPILAQHARDGEPIHPGHICIAPPDHHLLLENGQVRVSHGPRENRNRPSIDVLFRSAARAYGPRVVGVILTGLLHDGVVGLLAVRHAGGAAVVQDPGDALMDELPRSARAVAGADHVVPADRLAPLLKELVNGKGTLERGATMTDPLEKRPETVDRDMQAQEEGKRRGQVSTFTCPECGGSLWQVDEKELVRFRCHVGHAYNGEVLLEEQAEVLEAALWTAVRTFRERGVLARQLAAQSRGEGDGVVADRFEEAKLSERYGKMIQDYLLRPGEPGQGGSASQGKT
jgi:two-component system chemotaxis response regulator CheB